MAKKKSKNKQQVKFSPKAYLKTRARSLPIYKCWVNEDWEVGMFAHVVVSRKHDNGRFTFASYLVDLMENGLKDSFAEVNVDGEMLDIVIDNPKEIAFVEIDYDLAHNIVYQGLEFAKDMGAKGDKQFAWTQYVLQEDSDDIPIFPIPFGDELDDNDMDLSPLDLGATILLGMTDLIYLDTFGEVHMNDEFAEERLEADELVIYSEMDRDSMTLDEFDVCTPLTAELSEIELSDNKKLAKFTDKVAQKLKEHPDVPQLYDLLANLMNELSTTEEAYQILQQGIERFPENYTARFFYAINLLKMGKINEAEQLIWGAFDVRDLPMGNDGLGEFNVHLFYSVRCKIHMAKQEYDKAEPYYLMVRDIFAYDSEAISELQKDILLEYSAYRKELLEAHFGKSMEEIIAGDNWLEKYEMN
ncbi:hypothetical protein DN752_14380 [Echinicola strongylocentroti]|uniref:Uncharacterized protein n=1 Tax=Echinicola strongylocentroti TaxID=1795355 RepID=A0A2Z4IJV5_9BACT|nr:tetratricopeptide repeat protein [Echinicola strongylocentroti]AWW31215.1 hypothetical protein DN752_14380 [Echinicola strongylocentroti]